MVNLFTSQLSSYMQYIKHEMGFFHRFLKYFTLEISKGLPRPLLTLAGLFIGNKETMCEGKCFGHH